MGREDKLKGLDGALGYMISNNPDSVPSDDPYESMSKDDKLSGLDGALGYMLSSRPDSIPAENKQGPYAPERMNEDRFKPSDYAAKEYETYSRAMPKRDDYKPSTGRKLLGSFIAAASGNVGAGINFRDEKYNLAKKDYDDRGENMYKLAKLEDEANQRGMRNQNYTDMYRDRIEDNDRDAYYKDLRNDVDQQRLKDTRTRYEGIAADRERNYGLRERNTNSAIGARNAQLGISKERLALAKTRGNAPKAVDPDLAQSRQMDNQIKAAKIVDAELSADPRFSEFYDEKGRPKTGLPQELRNWRIQRVNDLLKKGMKPNSVPNTSETEPDEPDDDEDDPSGFNFQ